MKKLLIIILLFSFYSCSPQWHINRAIEKSPEILKEKKENIIIETKELQGSSVSYDTVIIDNSYVFIKSFIENDSINLFYKLKPQRIDTFIFTKYIHDTIRTRQVIRLEARQKRLETKSTLKTNILEIRKDARVEIVKAKSIKRINSRPKPSILSFFSRLKCFIFYIVVFIFGLICGYIIKFFK